MKKHIFLFLTVFLLFSCGKKDSDVALKLLPIDSVEAPQSFTKQEVHNITVTYTLPNSCYSLYNLHYEYAGTSRLVSIIAIEELDEICAQATIQKTYTFTVLATQTEDYVFKFFKGVDTNGNDVFEELIIPVN